MTKRIFVFGLTLAFAAGVFSCASSDGSRGGAGGGKGGFYSEQAVSIPSVRGTRIPGILTLPNGGGNYPVAILAHGHGGSKDEAGGFSLLARSLGEQGVASLRIDFPGCGDSAEDFSQENNLTNMLNDVRSAKAYLASAPGVDPRRLGILGYSMGGRIAALIVAEDSAYQSAVFWSPAISPGGIDMHNFMQNGSDAAFEALYAEAREKGRTTYTAVYGFEQTLALQWFDDMTRLDPLAAFGQYRGAVLLITGAADEIIPPAAAKALSRAATGAKSVKEFEVPGADHGYGIYSERPDITMQAVNQTVSFFKDTL
ncbi:MAG: alpha/beta fold hydrolase [Treponema sp.]|jgi:dienelactone hydrolase|nr:alpha/beta fold hydrolase [Treponema sp.]